MNLFTTTCLALASITGATQIGCGAADINVRSVELTENNDNTPTATLSRKTFAFYVSGQVGADKWHHRALPSTMKDARIVGTTFPFGWGWLQITGHGTNTLTIRPNTQGVDGTRYREIIYVEVTY